MPKQKPENKLSDKEQFKRFKEAAKEKGVDLESDEVASQFQRLAQKSTSKTER